MKEMWERVRIFLQGLSFRTGVLTLLACITFYLISFGVFWLPLSTVVKSVLWATFFGMAKAAQYSGLLILGKEGVLRLKQVFRKRSE